MASKAVNVFLNAYDNTASATSSASANVASYADSVVASNQLVESSFADAASGAVTSLAATLASTVAAAAPYVIAAGAIAAAGYLIYRNWESVGPLIASVGETIAATFSGLGSYVVGALESMIGGSLTWANTLSFLRDTAYAALAVIEFGWQNMADVGSLALVTLELATVKYFNNFVYTFTDVIPGLLVWFAENWREIFTDVYNYTATVIANMYENLVRFFTAVFEALSGNGFNFEWKGLTDGFEATLKKLPEIAERQIGPLEASLQKQFDDLGTKVSNGVRDNVVRRLSDIPGFNADISATFAGLPKQLAGFAGQLGGMLGLGGAGRGAAQAVSGPEGESSRFLTGVSASSQERLALEQLELQKQMAEAAKADAEWKRRFEQFFRGDFTGIIRGFAAGQASQIILTD